VNGIGFQSPCRLCGSKSRVLADFGCLPVPGYLVDSADQALEAPRFPLGLALCPACGLVQQACDDANQFLISKVYAHYQPTYSMSGSVAGYLEELLNDVEPAVDLGANSTAVEIGSNDGLLLERLGARGIHATGFEPSAALADYSRRQGHEVVSDYFGENSARKFLSSRGPVPLVITRHTLEHAFDPLDFLRGVEAVLASDGLAVIEVPSLWHQMVGGYFEGMSFQHVSFFSAGSLTAALAVAGLKAVSIRFVGMDGGSMVVFARKRSWSRDPEPSISISAELEKAAGLASIRGYSGFLRRVATTRVLVRKATEGLTLRGKRVVGFGAGGKGQQLMNLCQLDARILPFVIDDTPGNAGKFIPGTANEVIASDDPKAVAADVVLVTAPTHIPAIVRWVRYTISKRAAILATVPDFHEVIETL
jgi:SAM-dependent methyltransferase